VKTPASPIGTKALAEEAGGTAAVEEAGAEREEEEVVCAASLKFAELPDNAADRPGAPLLEEESASPLSAEVGESSLQAAPKRATKARAME